jgi:gamma-glutamyl hydrolase
MVAMVSISKTSSLIYPVKEMIAIIEMPSTLKNRRKPHNYIKWLESAGITSVCIPYNLPKEDLLICLDKVDGVLWTGGAIENKTYTPHQKKVYTDTLYTSFEVAKKYNDQGRKYPIWGTCQGFEFLVLFHNGKHTSIHSLPKHYAEGTFPITFTGNSFIRKWFGPLAEEMKQKPCATHHHKYGVNIQPMSHLRILSTQEDYINIIQYKEYPFYGVQFHPERPFDAFSKKVSKHFALFLKSLL